MDYPKADELIDRIVSRFETSENLVTSDAYLDGGTSMLFPRFRRAALNQCTDGEAVFSRYAIWGNTVRDYISEAIKLIEQGDNKAATTLLISAHNSLSAFSEFQKNFDPFEVR